jgi:anthraniloyl-CoA monooxygenase
VRVDIIGAGPAGLYSAILLKKSYPAADIQLVERNRADDTFGFGIVLSDETLANLARVDATTHQEIAANFAYWDDIHVQYQGHVLKSSGHGFSGIRRLTLLEILQRRAEQLGISVRYQEDAKVSSDALADHHGADLLIAADGINSAVREFFRDQFQPSVDLRSNRFTWLGARMNLPAFFYSFREDDAGLWNMHAYQYTPGESTIVIETTDETFRRSGLKADDEAATATYVERLFAADLKGARVLTNRSLWRQFPTISCKRWHLRHHGLPIVLLGDAAHTAHFSIGSGTKLALEDAIALHDAMVKVSAGSADIDVDQVHEALGVYEETRRDEVGRIQHSANVSLVWFENVRRFWQLDPIQFNISVLTRSKQITYENLRLRDAGLVERATRWWNTQQAAAMHLPITDSSGHTAPWLDSAPMFAPLKLRELWLANRVVVSPMAQYSAIDGVPNDWHLVHYGARSLGGAGLVFIEMTCPSAEARITPGCTGLWNQAQMLGFKRVVDFVHANSAAKLCMQLGHAGRKGSTQLGWDEIDYPLDEQKGERNWPLIAPSAVPYRAGVNQAPRAMTRADMDQVISEFVHSARLAEQAGFDMLELHIAHGYLLASFLTPLINQRSDEYGGSMANRLRFPLQVFEAVRACWPQRKPMSVRLSATDWVTGGLTPTDSVEVAHAFKALGCDLIDVSSGQTDPASKPVYGRMYQAGFAEQIRLEVGIATMAVGAVTSADQVNTLLISGRADLVALGRPHLADPCFTLRAAAEQDFRGAPWPVQYHAGASQLHTTVKRAREDAERKLLLAKEN